MLLDEIAYHLQTNSIGTIASTAANGIYKAFMPHAPATCTVLYEYTGQAPQQRFSSSTPAYEIPHFQIVCRSTSYATARTKAHSIFKLLNGVVSQTIKPSSGATGCTYFSIEPNQSPFDMGKDENDYMRVACNYAAKKNLST